MEKNEKLYDVVIIGGGPAGLTAALYLARACYRVIVVEKEEFGGQITITQEVVNYPGVYRTNGRELTAVMKRQAENFGALFLEAEVMNLDAEGEVKTVRTSAGELSCFGILLATGAHPRMLGFPGEKEYRGRGVAYCATCDGEFFTGKEVFVIGGGFAAAEESVFLTKYAKHVTILVREEDFTCAKQVAQKARNHEKITVLTEVEVDKVEGDAFLTSITYHSNKTGEVTTFRAAENENIGVFVFVGYEPATSLVKDLVEISEQGYVVTDGSQKTCIDGIYAAGDVCVKNLRQVVTAVGDGAVAATELERYAAQMQEKTGLRPISPCRIRLDEKGPKAGTEEEEAKSTDSQGVSQEMEGLFNQDMKNQLNAVFEKMEQPLILRLFLDASPLSGELKEYMESLAKMTNKLTVETENAVGAEELPCVRICRGDGVWTGLAFHGVPGGHEFSSFVMGLYNAAGEGQRLERELSDRIAAIDKPKHMKVVVSLSCTMCPELVIAVQKIASRNGNVTADIYDVAHFPELKEKYQIMSVPCMVINDGTPHFGKKNLSQVLDIIEKGIDEIS